MGSLNVTYNTATATRDIRVDACNIRIVRPGLLPQRARKDQVIRAGEALEIERYAIGTGMATHDSDYAVLKRGQYELHVML